jgi:hypothetical protein
MSYLLSPVFNDAQFDSAGDPLTGGKLYWYVAGTSTAATVYTDSSGATSHANPIVLDSRGEPGNPIYLDSAVSYKAVLKTSADVTIRTLDGITGIASPSEDTISEWVSFGGAPTYVDADEFTLAGDQTSIFHVNRRVRLTLSGSTLYGTIISSAYTTSTALQVVLDSGSLDGTLTAVAYGFARQSYAIPIIDTIPKLTSYSATLAPGRCVAVSAGFTLNTGLAAGSSFLIYNDSAAAITVTQGGGVTLRIAGTTATGNITVPPRALATVWANSTTEYILSGSGVY